MHHAVPRLVDPGRLSNFADEFRYVYRKGNIHKAPRPLVWLLLLAACGGGGGGGGPTTSGTGSSTASSTPATQSGGGPTTSGTGSSATPKMVEISGFAYNRPLEGGEVWLDVNRNQRIDAGDYRVPGKVDSKGGYRGQVPENVAKSPVMVDTTTIADVNYRGKLPETMLAPEGSKVISPFTHALAKGDIKREQLKKDFDYLSQNPYEETTDPVQQAVNRAVIETLPKITNIISRTISNTQRIELLEAQFAALQKRFDNFDVQNQPEEVSSEPEVIPAEPELPAPPPAIDPPRFASGGTGTDLMEHETGRDVRVYDANAVIGAGSGGQVRFSLQGAPDWLAIDAASGIVTMTRAIDLDAAGEASRTVSFTVVARDSADASRTSQQRVSFTITNSDEQPAGMTVVSGNASFSETGANLHDIELARVTFVDNDNDNPAPAGQENSVTFSVSGSGHSLTARDFEFRNGGIFLKQNADTSVDGVDADATVTVTVKPATSGHGTRPAQQTFTFTITSDAPPPPENRKPSDMTLGQSQVIIDEGRLPQGALTRISITDDGLGTVGLAPLPESSIFRYERVDRTTYDLFLKDGVVLDQARVGDHRLTIQVTGDGAGTGPLPHASFILRVRDIEHDPVLTVTPPARQRRIDEDHHTTDLIDTGIRVDASDADGDLQPLEIESRQHDGSWQAEHRFMVSGGSLYMRPFQTFDYESRNNENGVIRLRITARDTDGNFTRETTSVVLSNVNEKLHGALLITGLDANNAVQTGNRVTANTDFITDPDGQPLFSYVWFRDGTEITGEEDSSLTPVQAGIYKLVVTATDPEFSTKEDYEYEFAVTASQQDQPFSVRMSATHYEWTEGTARPTTLATITIEDNTRSEFLVTAAGGSHRQYFTIVKKSRTEFELQLDPDTSIDSIPSRAPLIIQVTERPDSLPETVFFNFTSVPAPVDEEEVAVDQQPTGIRLEPATLTLKEGQTLSTALTTITIIDDGQGFARLAQLPSDSIFSLRQRQSENSTSTIFELHLKSGTSVDKKLLGSHAVELLAIGSGVPSGPAPRQTFTLHVQTELTVNEPTERPVINETVGDANTTEQIDTGITVTVNDPGGNLNPLRIESLSGSTWRQDNRFEVADDGTLYIKQGAKIDFESPGNPNGVITLRLTVTDDTGRNVHRQVSVHLSNVNEPATGEVGIQPSATGYQTGRQLVAESGSDDPDGVQQRQITWKKDGVVINGSDGRPVTGSTFTPTEAGHYQAILTVTDLQYNEQTFRSGIVTVTVAEAEPQDEPPEEAQQPAEVPVVPQPPQQEPDSATPQDPVLSVTGTPFLVERRATHEDTPTGLSYTATDPNGDTPTVTLLNEGDVFVLKNGQIFAKADAELISGHLYELRLRATDDTGRTVTQTTEILVRPKLLSAEINEWQHRSGQPADFEEVLESNAVPEKTANRPWHYNAVPYKLYFPQDKSFDFVIKSNWNGDEFAPDDRFYLPDIISREIVSDGLGGYRYTDRSYKFIRVHLNRDFDFEHTRDDGSRLPLLDPTNPFNFRKLSLQVVATDRATGEKYTSQTFYYAIENVNEPATIVRPARLEEQQDDGTWVTSDGVVDYGQRLRIVDFLVTDPDRAPEYYYRWYNPGQPTAAEVRNNVFDPQQSGVYNVEALTRQPGLISSTISAQSEKFTFTVNEIPEDADLKPTDFSLKIDVSSRQSVIATVNAGGKGPKNGRIGTIKIEDDSLGTNSVQITPRDEFTRNNDNFDVYRKVDKNNAENLLNVFRIKLKAELEWGDAAAGWYNYTITVTGTGLGFQPKKTIDFAIWLQSAAEEASTTTSSGSTGLIGQGPPEIDQDFLPGEPLSDDGDMGGVPDIL